MRRDSKMRAQINRAKKALEKTGELTPRQIDMAITAMFSLPYSVIEKTVEEMEKDPSAILKEIQIPARRY